MTTRGKQTAHALRPHNSHLALSFIIALACCSTLAADDLYFDHVKPLLRSRCFACHGALKQEGGLRLDASSAILEGSDSGEIVVSGEPQHSLIVERLTADDETIRMPPEGAALSTEELAPILEWIELGLPVSRADPPEASPLEHWAYQPIEPPSVDYADPNGESHQNPIDAILARHHQRQNLVPMPLVDRSRLARRVYLDLIGIPPTLSELSRFVADSRPDAYESLVEELLNRPEYGQRWGRHWMDIWRYSDWYGLGEQLRNSQKHIWRWRDWIVDSLNSDAPYDEMIVAMLAGDELAPTDPQTIRATGFLARNYYLFNRTTWLDSTIEHTSKAFLGLTVNCAKCHDHKYDPITQHDYYAFRAVLEPHQVRLDAVPGEIDLDVDAYPRAFDAHPQAQTYLHIRGNEKDPDLEQSILPAAPAFLSHIPFAVTPIELPWQAFQPGLRDFARQDHLAAAGDALAAARLELNQFQPKTEESDTAAAAERDIAMKRVRQAALRLPFLLAAYESHLANTAFPNRPDELEQLSSAAATAWRAYQLAQAELEVAEAKAEVAKQDNAEAQKRLKDAQQRYQQVAKRDGECSTDFALPRGSRKALEGPAETEESRNAAYPKLSTGRRLAFARWITHPLNPLTARVAVNHIWGRHFGSPLVDPVDDFGRRTKQPPLLDLLDFLADRFMQDEWRMKPLHRLIVTSTAYRRQSADRRAQSETLQLDRENQFHWSWPAKRMESQLVRDSILSLAGDLDPRLGGRSVDPKKQPMTRRRSLYFLHSRDDQDRFLNMFDDADILRCYRRQASVLPQQALTLMNSEISLVMAPQIAKRVGDEVDATRGDVDFVEQAFQLILCRKPHGEETAVCVQAMAAWKAIGEEDRELRAQSNLVHTLLNHNDFITIR